MNSANNEFTLGPGQQRWHSSEEDGGPDVGIEVGMPDGSILWFGEISTALWETCGGGVLATDKGWWAVHYPLDRQPRLIGPVLTTWLDSGGVDYLAAAARPDFVSAIEQSIRDGARPAKGRFRL